jgi:hypothetical protein
MIPSLPDDEQERRTRRLLDGACRLVDSMKEVGEDLPLFRAVFSPHDNPNVFLTAEMKRQAVEAGSTLSPKANAKVSMYQVLCYFLLMSDAPKTWPCPKTNPAMLDGPVRAIGSSYVGTVKIDAPVVLHLQTLERLR